MRPIEAREKGFAWIFTAMTMIVIVPMIGLAIDTSVLYVVKAKLQGAVDGAALAGARALARGANGPAQIISAQDAAVAYVKLNIPDGYMLSRNVVPAASVDTTVAFQRTVSVTATVDSPALFMRIVGVNLSTVSASAQAVRRDVNISLVVDRSGSLAASGSCGAVRQSAINFVNKFSNLRDNLSLITFASTTYVNFPMANDFKTAATNVQTILTGMNCAGSTSTAMALWQGYDQLVGLNQPGALNVILLFTDGEPTAATFQMPVSGPGSWTGVDSPCTAFTGYLPAGSGPAGAKGYITGAYNTYSGSSQFFGLLKYQGTGSGGIQTIGNGDIEVAPSSAGCAYASPWSTNSTVPNSALNKTDFVGLPSTDIFGNSADTSYRSITHNTIGLIDLNNNANAQSMAVNAADDAARRIRIGTIDPAYSRGLNNITIFSIGLASAPFAGFLERVSNDTRSTIYDSTLPQGQYVAAPTSADIDSAFSLIASEILRLAR